MILRVSLCPPQLKVGLEMHYAASLNGVITRDRVDQHRASAWDLVFSCQLFRKTSTLDGDADCDRGCCGGTISMVENCRGESRLTRIESGSARSCCSRPLLPPLFRIFSGF